MTPEERTLFLSKSGAYAATQGVLTFATGGAVGIGFTAAKAGKLAVRV